MDINKFTQLKKKFPHAQIVLKQGDTECVDFDLEFKFTSENQWKIVIIPGNKNGFEK